MIKKVLITIFFVSLLLIGLTACSRPYVGILFNKDPITKETIMNGTNGFVPNQRIYFLFISEKPIVAKIARIQVYKYGDAGAGPTTLVYAKDLKVHMNEYYYITDYFVITKPGHYVFQVFARDE